MRQLLKTLVLFVLFPHGLFAAYSWPEVQPIEKEFKVENLSEAYVYFDVIGKNAQTLYHFECSTPDIASKRKIQFDYMGGFECRLWSPADERHLTLLVEDPHDNDWQSRGRFSAYELVGACGEYPEFGRIRHFKLRGMSITLSLDQVRLTPPESTTKGRTGWRLVSFQLRVSIRPDATAKSNIAEPSNAVEPPTPDVPDEADSAVLSRACKHVRYRRVPGQIPKQLLSSLGLDPPYPKIDPISASLQIGLNTPGSVVARNEGGKPTYKLSCDGIPNGFQSGLLAIECSLRRLDQKYDLLGETIDPYSLQKRSRITIDHILGACHDYPDWGASRTFDLRGFRLVVRLEELTPSTVHKGEYAKALMKVDISSESDASSPVALQSTYIDPGFLPLSREDACKPIKVDP